MSIRVEGSYDPNLLVVTSGYLGDLLDVNDSGRYHGATLVFNTGYGNTSLGGTWIIGTGGGSTGLQGPTGLQGSTGLQGPPGTGGFVSGANYLDELADVNLSGPIYSSQVFLNNGSYWHQAFFETSNLANTTGHALVDQDHALIYQPSINKYISTHVLAAPTGLRTTNSDAQMSGNTDILQARLNGDSGIVYIPTGTYRVNTLCVRGNNIHLFGPGKLLAQTGYNGDAVLVVSGNNCTIEGISIDCNGKLWSGVASRGEGLAIVGDNNTIRDVKVYNTPSGGASNAIAIRFGDNNLIERCYVSGAGFAAYYCNGDYNTFRNNTATHFRNRGFTFNGGPYNKLTIDGFYADSPVSFYEFGNGGASLQIDPGTGSDQYIRNVDLNRLVVGNGGSGGNCAKFAKLTNLNISNSVFYPKNILGDSASVYSTELSTDVRFAEGIENLTISNSWIASFINFDSIVRNVTISKTRFGEYMDNKSGNFGSGYNPTSHIYDLMASGTITIHDCEFYGFSTHAIDLDSPPRDVYPTSGYKMLDIQRCHFAGSGAGTLRDINITSDGAINWSRRIRYFDNTREAFGGGSPIITTSTWYPYFSPLNLNASEFSGTTTPTSTSTNWRVGDIIRNTTPITGGNLGWVCVQSGAPGTWLSFGDVGNLNNFIPTGLIAGTGADNRSVIANWTNLYGYALIPTGEWYIGANVDITKNNAKLFGPGTIKARAGFSAAVLVNIYGSGSTVEDITIDGTLGTDTSTLGLNLIGNQSVARNVKLTGIPHHSIKMPGARTLVDGCRIYANGSGASSAISANGPYNTIKNSYIEGWKRQGIAFSYVKTDPREEVYGFVQNCYIHNSGHNPSTSTDAIGILVDAGVNSSGYNGISLKDTTVVLRSIPNRVGSSFYSAIVKLAIVDQANIDNCYFYATETGANLVYGLGIAERVNKVSITNSYISPNIEYVAATEEVLSDSLYINNCKIGNHTLPRHSGYVSLNDIASKTIIVENCHLINSGTSPSIDIATGIVNKIRVTDCVISGYRDGNTFSALSWSSGGVFYPTNRLIWKNNTIQYGGNSAPFTASSPVVRFLQTYNDDKGYYSNITSATSSHVTGINGMSQIMVQPNTIVYNTGTLTPGSVYSWVCSNSGVGTGATWVPLAYFSAFGSFVPTGLVAGATANNSNIIGNWINTYGQALIPTGEWYISNKINVTKNNAKLYGPGTIKGQAGFNDTAIVNLLGTGCSVEDLTLDGSIADTAGGSIVLNLGGGHCFARNITITGTPHHGISMLGNRTLVDGCRIYGRTGVGSAINCSSYHTTVRDTYIENWGRQGIGLDQPRNGDNESFALVDNCRIVLNASGENGESKAGILIDTGVSTSGYSHVVIKNTNVIFEIAPSISSNVVKFALGHKVTVENCNFYTRATGLSISCGMRIAEGVNHLKITNTYISPGILWEDNALPDGERFTENVYLDNCKLGNFTRPFHSGYRAIESIRASNVIINGCQMKVSGIASAILTDTGNFRRLEVTNCIISGYRDGNTFSALFLSSGGLYHRTRSLYWNNNILGYQGDNSSFTASSPTSRFLQTANADGNRYFISGIPAGHNNVPTGVVGFWQIEFNQGDRIINTGVVKVGTTLEWVCVTGGIGSGNGVWLPVVTL